MGDFELSTLLCSVDPLLSRDLLRDLLFSLDWYLFFSGVPLFSLDWDLFFSEVPPFSFSTDFDLCGEPDRLDDFLLGDLELDFDFDLCLKRKKKRF